MRAFRSVTSHAVVLDRPDVDTDQIIPKQFLKRIERTGFGEFLFFDWRKDPAFELNQPGERCASTSNRNFEGRQGAGGRTHLVSPVVAAATAGLTRCVRPPAPCRPSKLRFDVDAHRSPGARTSGFIPRHMEQPARRHSKPASTKMRSSPSASAARFTVADPGTTIARTDG